MRITGTFLDEITYDIPSNNWGRLEWDRDFRIMRSIGIDTVILIRAGLGKVATFPLAGVLAREAGIYPVYTDLVQMFLDLSAEYGMDFWFGTYDSNLWARGGDPQREVEVGKAFIDEAWERYGTSPAFKGWYLTFEISRMQPQFVACLRQLGEHCKRLTPSLPTLISPYFAGRKATKDPLSLEQHYRDWDQIFGTLSGVVDVVAFQDGHVDYHELPAFLQANTELMRKHGLRPWSNLETFDRDMPINFPPTDFRKLRWKLDAAEAAGVEKVITFEFSHFMSPQSCWPAAGNLYRRYCEHFGIA